MKKCYIITEVNITDFTSKIICVYSDKKKAKKKVDELNSMVEDSEYDYKLESFEMDTEDIEYD